MLLYRPFGQDQADEICQIFIECDWWLPEMRRSAVRLERVEDTVIMPKALLIGLDRNQHAQLQILTFDPFRTELS